MLVRPATQQILAAKSGSSLHLPRISIPRWTRAAEQVQAIVKQKWGLKSIVIDSLTDVRGPGSLVIAEDLNENRTCYLSAPYTWADVSVAEGNDISFDERSTIERLLKGDATGRGAFSRFGWIEHALDWVSDEAGIDRSAFTGDVKQFNASGGFALARFDRKTAPPLWLKAVGGSSIREFEVSTMLSRLLPDYVPTVLAYREDWKAWWMEDAGISLDYVCAENFLKKAVSCLAGLQKESIRHLPSLLACGCSDQRIPILREHIPEIVDLIKEAMARQIPGHAPPLSPARVHAIGSSLEKACFRLEALGIPDTVLHGDINFGNILVGARRCVLTDWAHAAVGNPFVSFEQLREQIAQDGHIAPWTARLVETYRRSWREALTDAQIQCALAIVPPIAVGLYLLARWKWLGSEHRTEPQFQSCLRGLARQMDIASRALESEVSQCA